ncbi:MAG: RNA-binding S4 domain-containing protein [Chitinophagaceae bacterium]
MTAEEKLRIDKYLWAIRIFKTRAEASEACEKGKVRSQGNTVKASKQVLIGNEYEIRAETRKWVIKVTGLISNRVQYAEALKHYLDNTPNDEDAELKYQGSSFNTGKRNSKIGRPTKKERRDLDDVIGS